MARNNIYKSYHKHKRPVKYSNFIFIIKHDNIDNIWHSKQECTITCIYCGRRFSSSVYNDKLICRGCGHKVPNNSKEYFKYILRRCMNER